MLVEADGVEFYVETQGETESGAGGSVVFLHGMTLNGRDWESIVEPLSQESRTVTVDLIGHGRSQAPDTSDYYTIEAVVEQLRTLVEKLDLEPSHWVGYSMGGRILLQMAVRHPGLVESMVLESTTPGIESEDNREKRRRKDEKLADFLESRGLEAFVDRWLSAPIFESQQSVSHRKRDRARRLRLQNDPRGLIHCLRELGRGTVPHCWKGLDELRMPVKLLAGRKDTKHCEIHKRMHEELPNSSMTVLDGVGHNVHFEAPRRFIEECETFFPGYS